MITVESSTALEEFAHLYLESTPAWPQEYAGALFWGFIEPGHSNSTFMLCRPTGQTKYVPDFRPSWEAREALLDIPDEVDPQRASVAAVIVAYRASEGTWVAHVAFGDEAERLRPEPQSITKMAQDLFRQ